MDTWYVDNRDIARNGIMGNMLNFLLTNLPDDPIATWSEGDADWKKKGVFKAFWQPSFLTSSI